MRQYFHSVTLDKERCKGCTNCIKRCPTEAIRVRGGKATIIKERCIDCGECIRVCPYHAKKAVTSSMSELKKYKYKIALPAPSLYVQFKNKPDVNLILNGLKNIGFDEVFEVGRAAELVTMATKKMMQSEKLPKPAISSACPAVVRLIKVRFPSLIPNIVPILAPIELAAKIARENAIKKTNLSPKEIGVFFITPCAAKVTALHRPIGLESSFVDGAISARDIYKKLLPAMKKAQGMPPIATASLEGISWAKSGGESKGLKTENYIVVDGIQNVIEILEKIEDEVITDIDFVEASTCVGGCIGGPLNVENSFIAKTKIKNVLENTTLVPSELKFNKIIEDAIKWQVPVTSESVMVLDSDMAEAMKKMEKIEQLSNEFPGLDCGSCGAPSCHALAEDVVRGNAKEVDCVFRLRERVKTLAKEMIELESMSYGQGNN